MQLSLIRMVALASLVVVSFMVSCLSGAVVNFDAVTTNIYTPQIDIEGYRFNFIADGWGILTDDYVLVPELVRNGTPRLTATGPRNGMHAQVTITALSGRSMDLYAVDASTQFVDHTTTIEVIGNLAGGGTVNHTFSVVDAFATHSLPSSFSGLSAVTFRDVNTGGFSGILGSFALDNLQIFEVPEPASIVYWLVPTLLVVVIRDKGSRNCPQCIRGKMQHSTEPRAQRLRVVGCGS